MGSPRTFSVPQFPHASCSAAWGHPWVLLVSAPHPPSPLFPGTEVAVSVGCGLVAKFPETHPLPLPSPALSTPLAPRTAPCWQKRWRGEEGGERALQSLRMPIPGLGWMHRAKNKSIWQAESRSAISGKGVLEPPPPRRGLGGCGSGPCVCQDEPIPTGGFGKWPERCHRAVGSEQTGKGRDVSQHRRLEGLGSVVLGN